MKKLIALGVSTLSAASLVVGVVATPAAHAEEAPPLTEQVCGVVPDTLTEIAAALTAATDALAAADTEVADTKSAVDDAITSYALALVDWIDAVDNDPGVATFKEGIMNARFGDLVTTVVAWGEALTAQFNAKVEAGIQELRTTLVEKLAAGLLCVE